MQLADLCDKLYELVQHDDSSGLSVDRFFEYGLEGLNYIASQILLPKLQRSVSITFSNNSYIPFPTDDFMRELYLAEESKEVIQIFNSEESAARFQSYPYLLFKNLQIKLVADRYPKTIICKYYAKPYVSENNIELSNIFPPGFDSNILSHYILYNVYKWIEDGEEGNLVNTGYHRNRFNELLAQIDTQITTGQNRALPYRGAVWP